MSIWGLDGGWFSEIRIFLVSQKPAPRIAISIPDHGEPSPVLGGMEQHTHVFDSQVGVLKFGPSTILKCLCGATKMFDPRPREGSKPGKLVTFPSPEKSSDGVHKPEPPSVG
jgi:hypothetical protein